MSDQAGVFDVSAPGFRFTDKVLLDRLQEDGFVVLRGVFSPDLIADAAQRIDDFANSPAIAGVPGYSKVDYPKRIFNPLLVGGPLVDLVLDERIVELIETYMDSECILAETNVKIDEGVNYTYFDLHSDFSAGWRKSEDADFVLTQDDMGLPLAVTMAIYFHRTTEGAFSYCPGTHKMGSPRGPNLSNYPPAEQQAIRDKKVRIEGEAGDVILFDDRGFHGPDHPSRHRRTVILADYYRVETFGFTQISPMPVWTSDLGRLSKKQMRVLGAGADYMVPVSEYTGTRFRRSRLYPLIKFLVEHAYAVDHLKQKIKKVVRRGA